MRHGHHHGHHHSHRRSGEVTRPLARPCRRPCRRPAPARDTAAEPPKWAIPNGPDGPRTGTRRGDPGPGGTSVGIAGDGSPLECTHARVGVGRTVTRGDDAIHGYGSGYGGKRSMQELLENRPFRHYLFLARVTFAQRN
jgi:hypothetical protein